MKIRVDPRTGTIVRGKPRPLSDLPSTPKFNRQNNRQRSANTSANIPAIDLNSLMKVAEKIGQVTGQITGKMIVDALASRPLQAYPVVRSQAYSAGQSQVDSVVTIDESIIDVGIGDTEELQKGTGSAILAEEETNRDTGLSHAANKLRALKKGA